MLKKCIFLFALLLLLPACAAQKTLFVSEPPGAQISVNGEVIGKTPCEYEYRAGTDKTYKIAVRKEHYQAVEKQFTTDAIDKESRQKWLVAGLVWSPLWLGAVFTKKLEDSYHFVLTRIKQASEPAADLDERPQILSLKKGEPPPDKGRQSS